MELKRAEIRNSAHSLLRSRKAIIAMILAFVLPFPGCASSVNEVEVILDAAEQKPVLINHGRITADSTHTTKVRVRNNSVVPIEIDSFHTSCECTSVLGLPMKVPEGDYRDVHILTDLSQEKGFTGGLGVLVEFRSKARTVGVVEVSFTVEQSAK